MKAIVLSGGGAKGAYQAGVWQALRKLRIKYDIVTGTSIGALNGMFMVQKDFNKCLYLWKNINFDQIYNDFKANNKKEIYKSYFDSIIKGGISTLKIEQLIANNYNPKKLYNSKIKYGVVTYNVSNLSVYYATNENTKAEQLKNYIMASATCFPVFKPKKIDNDTYIDGGFYDNLPLNLAIDLGATQIIAVDLDAVGIKKRVKNREVKITSISPTNKLESFLMFDKNVTKKMIKFGYNDTLKAFNKLEGHTYTFKKGFLNNNYKKHHLKF
ncbi:MAG: patatin-like phospholipase family protein, partial [Bacilli bacterium]